MRVLVAIFRAVGPILALILLPAALAGGVAWPRGLVLAAAYCAILVPGAAALFIWRPAHYAMRRESVFDKARRQPLLDRGGAPAYVLFLFAWLIALPFDVARLHGLGETPAALRGFGLAAVLAGLSISQLAVWQNAFATPAIQDQSDRGQTVVDHGIYGLIRHPLYAGNLVAFSGTALWMGSLAGLAAVALMLIATLARIVIEERDLRQRLPQYADYARRVRGRLIPFVL